MIIDRSVYPDVEPPATLQSLADRADYKGRSDPCEEMV